MDCSHIPLTIYRDISLGLDIESVETGPTITETINQEETSQDIDNELKPIHTTYCYRLNKRFSCLECYLDGQTPEEG